MAKQAKPGVLLIDFPGMNTAVDPRDQQDGAAEEQINCCSIKLGQLDVRRGMKEVSFEE